VGRARILLVEDDAVRVGTRLGGELELVRDRAVAHDGDMTLNERVWVAVPLELRPENGECPRAVERNSIGDGRAWRRDVPDEWIGETRADADRLGRGRGCIRLED